MFKWFQGRNKRVVTGIIIAIVVLAMVVPVCINFFYVP